MEVPPLTLIPCLFTTLVVQALILAQKRLSHASTQTTILQLTSILTPPPIPTRCHLYLISTPISLIETIPWLQVIMILIGVQYLAQLSRVQVKNGPESPIQ